MKKSIFSIILALVMVAGMITAFSINASAVDNSTDETLPEVSISMGKFICYDNKQEALASVAHSKLKSPPDDECFIYASMDQSTNTITIAERSKVLRFDVGYVPITTSIAVPANTSYSVTYTFEVKCGRVCDSDVTAMAELFDFGTTDASSSLKFNTDTKSNNSSSSSSAYSKFRTTTTTSSTKIGTYTVTVIYENDTNEVKTFSRYFGFFAGVRKTYEEGNQHKLNATCAISTAVDKLPTITFDTGDGGTVIAPITQEAGTDVTAPADPTRANYIFAGWDQDIPTTMPEEDMTITALWIPKPDVSTVFNELFTFQCTEVEDHSWCVNFRSQVSFVNDSAKYNEETGYWEAQLKITSTTFGLVNNSNIKRDYFGGITHHYDTSNYTFDIYYDPEFTGQSSSKQETTGLWRPLDEYIFDVYCYSEPAGANLSKITSKAIWVLDADSAYRTTTYSKQYAVNNLIADTYTVSKVYEENGKFYMDITVTDLTPYIEALEEQNSKEYYLPDWEYHNTAEDFTFRLVYTGNTTNYTQDGTGWALDATNTEKLNGKRLWVVSKATVTFKDGLDDVVLFADESYTVDVVYENGANKDTWTDFTYTATPEFIGDPTRTGYTFAGWTPEVAETVTEDVTYNAAWSPITYTFKFNNNGGEGEMEDLVFTYDEEQGLTLNTFTKTGYSFSGWTLEPNGEIVFADGEKILNYTVDDGEEITIYAFWGANDYTVIFDANGGTGTMANQAMTYDLEQKLAANQFTRVGYTFAGWSTEPEGPVEYTDVQRVMNLVPEGTVTLYAQWDANRYVVNFDAGNGYGTMASQSFTYDEYQMLSKSTFINEGFKLKGWAIVEGGKVVYVDQENVKNIIPEGEITLHAVWELRDEFLKIKTYLIYVKDADHGEVTASRKNMPANCRVVLNVTPDAGYELDTLVAVTRSGYTVKLTDEGNGKYSFKMPMAQVNITATFKEIEVEPVHECPGAKFEDLSTDAWYHEGVDYMIENNLMNGVSDTKFSPDTTLNRAMIATILWRLEGEPKVDFEMSFTDVEDGQWYTEAIRWAASTGIVNGFEDGTFKPTDAITRQQLALMIYRYAESKDADVAVSTIPTNADAADVADWAKTAVYWAIENGIYVERDGAIEGLADAIRAEAAVMISNFCQK